MPMKNFIDKPFTQEEMREYMVGTLRGGITMRATEQQMKQREKECKECEYYGYCTRTTIYKFDGHCHKHPIKESD